MEKIKQIPIYFDNNKKQYITDNNDLVCSDCDEPLDLVFFYYFNWGDKFSISKILCMSCINKQRCITSTEEVKTITVVDKITLGAVPVIIKPIKIGSGGIETVFSMAMKNREGEQVIDNTVLAGKIDFEHKARVEQRIAERELELNNKTIKDEDDFDDLMLDMKQSTPYQEERELTALEIQDQLLGKRIEDKSKKDGNK